MTITIKPTRPALPPLRPGLDGMETVAGGVGGWETLERPRRAAAAGWVGEPARTLTIPIIFDGMEARGVGRDQVVEAQVKTLTSWGRKHRKTDRPPILKIRGLKTVSESDRWVIQDIAWGDYITDERGRRIQQQATVTLLRFVEPKIVKGPAAKARDRKKSKGK